MSVRPPELVILCGLQASGKTTFYRQQLADTHAHVSKDLLRHNRRKEARQRELIVEALGAGRSLVVDNTNPTRADRARLLALGHNAGATVTGYFFVATVGGSLRRNAARTGRHRVPDVGILSTAQRLQPPAPGEGYDALFLLYRDHPDRPAMLHHV